MKIYKHQGIVFGEKCTMELMSFSRKDARKWKNLFDMWRDLRIGIHNYKSRGINFPEGLSEIAFCVYSGSKRIVSLHGKSSVSFDTFNTETNRAEQIKATSVKSDLSSFGPKSCWDDLYFLDFYNEGKIDGKFNVYKIPSELVYNMKVNKKQTFKQQQEEKRRPRLHIIEKIIIPEKLSPLATNVKIW